MTARDPTLQPLPYHLAIRDYLRREEAEVWQWFASQRTREEHADATRFELLKSTYRVDRDDEPKLYSTAAEVAAHLALDVPITVYQAQNPVGLNASLAFVPGEAHLVLHGPVRSQLSDDEFRALLAHELSHQLLWEHWDSEFLIADQILATLTNDRHADPSHFATTRLFRLFTEVFCDRGSLLVVDDPRVVVSMLVKVSTGVEQVNADSYLRQAEEIFAANDAKAEELTHPEAFIRARAVKLWADGEERDGEGQTGRSGAADDEVAKMLVGQTPLDEFDLLAREELGQRTKALIDVLLRPAWIQTELTLGHARLFFDDYAAPDNDASDGLAAELAKVVEQSHDTVRDYFCFVMLDFATADRDLEELPLAATLTLAESLGLAKRYRELAGKELRLRKKQLDKIDQQKDNLLAKAKKELAPQ